MFSKYSNESKGLFFPVAFWGTDLGAFSSLEGARLLAKSSLLWVLNVAHTLCGTEVEETFQFLVSSTSLQKKKMELT